MKTLRNNLVSPALSFISFSARAILHVAFLCAMGLFIFLGVGPHTGKYASMTVLSDSMKGSFSKGDLIITEPTDNRSLRSGQVIVYQPPGRDKALTHRIIGIKDVGSDNPIVQTKGDANDTKDPWEARLSDGPTYVVTTHIPYLGNLILQLRNPKILPILIWVVPAIFLLLTLKNIWFSRKPEETKDGSQDPISNTPHLAH